MRTYIVARPLGAGMDDTYATLAWERHPGRGYGSLDREGTVEFMASEEALWPVGTKLQVWRVDCQHVGEARLTQPTPGNWWHHTVEGTYDPR